MPSVIISLLNDGILIYTFYKLQKSSVGIASNLFLTSSKDGCCGNWANLNVTVEEGRIHS